MALMARNDPSCNGPLRKNSSSSSTKSRRVRACAKMHRASRCGGENPSNPLRHAAMFQPRVAISGASYGKAQVAASHFHIE